METDVLIVGAGPVGLMAAVELRRRGVDVVIVDKRAEPARWAKAVGVQPRTLEIFDAIGVAREAVDASETLRGQLVYVNGTQVAQVDMTLPPDVPYLFTAIPQYTTEEILAAHLARLGTTVRRGAECVGFTMRDDGVLATIAESGAEQHVSAGYLVGADGAHSMVRKALGLSFEGDAFPEEYMLADVELDWDLPRGFVVRAMHQTDGVTDGLLVCVPLPGPAYRPARYRMSMLVPDELKTRSDDPVAHGLSTTGPTPQLHHIQAVLDSLAPQQVTAATMRWSSVFRISHRLAGAYQAGRGFVMGDAAHIHPPTGAQGMNTGLQDAYNLGWKLALAVQGAAAPGLLDSYHAERHPIGEEVVGRTVRNARAGIGAGEDDVTTVLLREAQLLLGYPDSPIVGGSGSLPGLRAPDAPGLRQDPLGVAVRCHELFRHAGHTLLLWTTDVAAAQRVADEVVYRTAGRVSPYVVVPAGAAADLSGRTFADGDGKFAAAYGFDDAGTALVRPDGYVGYHSSSVDADELLEHLGRVMLLAPPSGR